MRVSSAHKSILKSGRRWLYLIHRWLGIGACLLFLLWFGSGIVMMYVPYPSLEPEARRAALRPIDWSRVAVSPTVALAAAGARNWPEELRLEMAGTEPIYRIIGEARERTAASAVTGKPITSVTEVQAKTLAADFGHAPATAIERIDRDQWTVAQGFDPSRPLYRVVLDDDRRTELYVSSRTGEIVQATTRFERVWNWAGAVPHWLYLTAIRQSAPSWRQLVMWTSGPATVVGITGLWIGILRLRLGRRRYASRSTTPYRGWMKWHHLAGLVGGLSAITWMASGWLSVNPFDWFGRSGPPEAERRYRAHDSSDFPVLNMERIGAALPDAREARFTFVNGRPLVMLATADRVLPIDPANATRIILPTREIMAAATHILPGAAIAQTRLLTAPDEYWYSHSNRSTAPVLRIIFDDPARTWVHIDPATSTLLGATNSSGRTYRWLFNAVHQFDLGFLLANRFLRDPLMWLLSALGIVMSTSGVVIGWRRLRPRPCSPDGRRMAR